MESSNAAACPTPDLAPRARCLFTLKLVAGMVFNSAFFAVPLLLSAGTLDWWRAWVILGANFVGGVVVLAALLRSRRSVVEERLKLPIQKGQPRADKLLVPLIIVAFLGVLVFSSLDVFRLHLMNKPGPLVSSLGLALFAAGWGIAVLALWDNTFASAAVRHQKERHQTVIDTGVYGVVRHPMYAGAILLITGLPLWLESYPGALLAVASAATLVMRILVEERFLKQELEGYHAYTQRVRYRLVPFVW